VPLPNNVSASRPIATVYGGGLQHVETGEADWVLTLERLGVTRDKRPLHNVRDNI
jgi:hypothetical protein